MRAFAELLIAAGAPVVVIDPDPRNERARRAYARAGFVGDQIAHTVEGPAVVMVFSPKPPPQSTAPAPENPAALVDPH